MDYLDFHNEKLFEGKIPLAVFENAEKVFQDMANIMVDTIIQNNLAKKKTLFIVPVGPIGQYRFFVNRINREKISLKEVTFIAMDEYLDEKGELLNENHPLSFRKIIKENCYDLIDPELIMSERQRIFPTARNGKLIEEIIEKQGVDICFGGVGINGHLAFNEPQENMSVDVFRNLSIRVQKIAKETKVINSLNELEGAYYLVPDYAITLGMKQILKSHKIRIACFRPWHRSVIRRALFGDVSSQFPVTLLQEHPDALISISKELQIDR